MYLTLPLIAAAYLVGALPFGYLVARWHGVDIFHQGSGNIGATNVGRVLGRRWGIVVFVFDFLKGAVPTAVANWMAPGEFLPVGAGLAAILGHIFPVYLGFRGGKGVATATGVVTVLLPWATAAALLAWVAVVCACRYVSLASLTAAVILCAFHLAITPEPFAAANLPLTGFCLAATALVFVRHRDNLSRLLAGSENRLKDSATMDLLTRTVHVVAVGLWFGAGMFFTFVVGLSLFATFDELTAKPAAERPLWLPVPPELEKEQPSPRFPDPLRKEQGSRIAGAAVGPMFPYYYGLQAVCAVLALATALAWSRSASARRLDRVRTWVLAAALATVAVGWWLEHEVSALRVPRSEASDAVLRSGSPTPEQRAAADTARAAFGRWHFSSLMQNFVTLGLVTAAMVLSAQLPAVTQPPRDDPPR